MRQAKVGSLRPGSFEVLCRQGLNLSHNAKKYVIIQYKSKDICDLNHTFRRCKK